jgi:NADPH:quinone reductase-like Zn-dependent oxidoreductase
VRSLAVFGGFGPDTGNTGRRGVRIDAALIDSAIIRTPALSVNLNDAKHRRWVLVRVEAFSCNFRDKSFMLQAQLAPRNRFIVLGSEFAGTVIDVGAEVTAVRPGDRVIAQNHYQQLGVGPEGVRGGIPTNHASRELQLLHEDKLIRIPDRMPVETAAAFSLGAQTAYSMTRKLAAQPGERVLVTSAVSNTSLFGIAALRRAGATVFATTSSAMFADRLLALGVQRVLHTSGETDGFANNRELSELAGELGGFAGVFDPFFDVHLETAVDLLAPFGRYVTCGLAAQNPQAASRGGVRPLNAERIMHAAITKNLCILGNCIGLRDDLARALADFEQDRLSCVIDSVYGGEDAAGFLERTFTSRERFGKVVFNYN